MTHSVMADDNRFPSLYVLGRLVDSITLTLSSPSQLQHVRTCLSRNLFLLSDQNVFFFLIFEYFPWKQLKEMIQGKRGDLGTAARSIEHALERTRINVDWKSSYYKTVDALMASWHEAFQGQWTFSFLLDFSRSGILSIHFHPIKFRSTIPAASWDSFEWTFRSWKRIISEADCQKRKSLYYRPFWLI